MITSDATLNWPTLIALFGGVVAVWRLLVSFRGDIHRDITDLRSDVRVIRADLQTTRETVAKLEERSRLAGHA